jgi:hypothetical protein
VRSRSQTPKKRLVSDRVLNARCLWTSSRVVADLAAKAFVSICVAIRPSGIDRRPKGVAERVFISAGKGNLPAGTARLLTVIRGSGSVCLATELTEASEAATFRGPFSFAVLLGSKSTQFRAQAGAGWVHPPSSHSFAKARRWLSSQSVNVTPSGRAGPAEGIVTTNPPLAVRWIDPNRVPSRLTRASSFLW